MFLSNLEKFWIISHGMAVLPLRSWSNSDRTPFWEKNKQGRKEFTIFGLENCALCSGMHIRPCHVANIIPGNWDCIPEPILQKRIHKFFANQQKWQSTDRYAHSYYVCHTNVSDDIIKSLKIQRWKRLLIKVDVKTANEEQISEARTTGKFLYSEQILQLGSEHVTRGSGCKTRYQLVRKIGGYNF